MDEAWKPYAIRMKEARAAARAQREAEKAARHRQLELIVECRRMALELTKTEIRDRGDKIGNYTTPCNNIYVCYRTTNTGTLPSVKTSDV